MSWYDYDAWEPTDLAAAWIGGTTPTHEHELDPHVDLGCGTIPKGRIGVDRYPAPGVAVVTDLDKLLTYGHVREPNTDVSAIVVPGDSVTIAEATRQITDGMARVGLPFEDSSIKSIISHHCFEHIGPGFIALMDEIYRVLEPGGVLRAITPLFPSRIAVEDPDHCRYFMIETWSSFCGHLGDENNPTGSWLDAFSVPYTKARFSLIDRDYTPPVAAEDRWGDLDVRELRVSLAANK